MKPSFALSLLLLFPTLCQAQHATPVFRDVATHEQLVERYRTATAENPLKQMPQEEGEDPSLMNPVENLVESSDIVSFNGSTTLVPKLAILQIPDNFKDRINNHQDGSRILSWLDFYTINRGWITTVEVKRAQAEGKEPIPEETLEVLTKGRNLVVATYQGGPISVRPPKEDASIQTASKQTQP